LGKLVSALFTIIGVALFALPAGIIGAGLAFRIEKEESHRDRKKRKIAAVLLIQSVWRCHKMNDNDSAISTIFQNKPKSLFISNCFQGIAIQFIRMTKFFAAKSKFKRLMKNFNAKYSFDNYRISQIKVKNKVKQVKNSVDSIIERVETNEKQINNSYLNLMSRIEKIDLMINEIENQFNKQMFLFEMIAQNPIFNENLINTSVNLSQDNSKNICNILQL
jgi:hypothetical protein